MESGTFLRRSIQNEFKRFMMIELHTDGRSAETREPSLRNRKIQSDRFGTIALPYYVLTDKTGRNVYAKAGGAMSEEDFLKFLTISSMILKLRLLIICNPFCWKWERASLLYPDN